MISKVHRIAVVGGALTGSSRTNCGLEGWRSDIATNEFDTALGKRFEATEGGKVTCLRCLKGG